MAEPFVFCFRPDAHGHPELMYIHDLWCGCGVCGHSQIQRFYHAAPFHSLTVERLLGLINSAHEVAQYDCENCGSEVGPEDVETAVIRFAFADDCGEVVIYISHFGQVDGPDFKAQFFLGRRLDPQVQPRFEPEPELPCHTELYEDLIAQQLKRPVSIKQSLRDMMLEWEQSDELDEIHFLEQLTPHFWALVGDAHPTLLPDVIEAHPALDDTLTWIELSQSVPEQLATYNDASNLPGAWMAWIPEGLHASLDDVEIWCGVSAHAVEEVMERAFSVARLSFEKGRGEQGGVVYSQISTPREQPYDHDVTVQSVLRRAVYTGVSPGEAARQTAEEIVGVMLRVWKPAE